jgi:carbon monoxide dehydrogenase subunit G
MIVPAWLTASGLARRGFRTCLLSVLLMLTVPATARADSPLRAITVAYDGATYVCDALMYAPVRPALAWEVLTDFDHMAQWVPNVQESRVLKREANTATIEQRGTASFGALHLPYTTSRRIEMDRPNAIKSVQVKGSLPRVESLMTLEPEGQGVRLNYHLEIVPSLLARAVLSKDFLEHELTEQFTAIVDEMRRRAR